MAGNSRVRVYIACSLDGFIAGPGDDLSWLPGAQAESASDIGSATSNPADQDVGAVGFEDFMSDVGAVLMGRRTYDAAAGFGGASPYGDRPVLVATHRVLDSVAPNVQPVAGDISEMVAAAREAAGDEDVNIDGGDLIRQAMDASLVDELIVTMVPVLLGAGHALFAGVTKRHALEFVGHHRFGGSMVQLHCRPVDRS